MKHLYFDEILNVFIHYIRWIKCYWYYCSEVVRLTTGKYADEHELVKISYKKFLQEYISRMNTEDQYWIFNMICIPLYKSDPDKWEESIEFDMVSGVKHYIPTKNNDGNDKVFKLSFLDFIRFYNNKERMYRYEIRDGRVVVKKEHKRTIRSTLIRWTTYRGIMLNKVKYNTINSLSNYNIEGRQFWYARKIMIKYGYKDWDEFKFNVVRRSIWAAKKDDLEISKHFKLVQSDTAFGKVEDYMLSYAACGYVIADGIHPHNPNYIKAKDDDMWMLSLDD